MSMKRALQAILAVAMFGLVFSGVLSYQELFAGTAAQCPSPGAPGTVFGYPACVYGFFMYLGITALAVAGLRAKQPSSSRSALSFAGLLRGGLRFLLRPALAVGAAVDLAAPRSQIAFAHESAPAG